jgi:proteasome lid subunit RPN8/RPN11
VPQGVGKLRLSARHLELLKQHVASAIPHEVCGFLGGVDAQVMAVIPVPNIAPDPAREFLMDPQAQWEAMVSMSESGWNMLAIYHSHPPGGQTEPSASDIATAHYPEALTLVIVPDPAGEISSLRAFAIDAGQVCEVSIALES